MAEVGNGHAYAYYSIFGTQRWAHFVRQTNFKTLFTIFMIFNILVKAVKWSNKKKRIKGFCPREKKTNYFLSLIFVKNSPTAPIGSWSSNPLEFSLSDFREKFPNCSSIGSWSSNPLEFLRYLFSLLKYDIYSIFSFL